MADPKFPQLPFLTREMLKFGNKAKFELEVVHYSDESSTFKMVGLTREGVIKFDVINDGTRDENSDSFQIPDIPISLTLFTNDTTVERGEFYASIYLKVEGERVYKLCSGYVTKQSGINFPQTHDESETGGPGQLKLISFSDPSAGAEISADIRTDEVWQVHLLRFILTTDATVANRRVHVQLPFGNSTAMINCISDTDQVASTARYYWCAVYGHLPTTNDDNDILIPIPGNTRASNIRPYITSTTNLQAGDQFSDLKIGVEAWIED